jgi:hypothetical protein
MLYVTEHTVIVGRIVLALVPLQRETSDKIREPSSSSGEPRLLWREPPDLLLGVLKTNGRT